MNRRRAPSLLLQRASRWKINACPTSIAFCEGGVEYLTRFGINPAMKPSSRTPEGWPDRCQLCGNSVRIEPSVPPGDAPCPHCGHLLWFQPPAEGRQTVFTTGEAAKICDVSQQTIIRCFDNGSIKGFRVPGSRFRRIPRDKLYAFMRENGISTDTLEG